MSGHSKWSKVKHQKESTDAVKGKIFTKMANAIIIAVRGGEGITDPEKNYRLRLAIDRAKSVNMPKENINRAIEKAKKTSEGLDISEVLYEAFGPGGIGFLIQAATDNRQRTVSEVKNVLERGGGVLAEMGTVSHLFTGLGLIEIEKNNKSYDEILELAMDAGGSDVEEREDRFLIYTSPADLHKVREFISSGQILISAELVFKPIAEIEAPSIEVRSKITGLKATLEDREDVLKVYSNLRADK